MKKNIDKISTVYLNAIGHSGVSQNYSSEKSQLNSSTEKKLLEI